MKFDNINSYNVRDEYKHLSLDELKEQSNKTRFNYSVMLFNLLGDLNIGSSIRTAHLMGAKKVYLYGKSRFDRRSLVGANNYIDIEHIEGDPENPDLEHPVFRNYIVPIELTRNSKPFREYTFVPDPVFLFGNEGSGVPEIITDRYESFHIPQTGVMRSLNVSVSVGIILNQYVSKMGYL